MQNQEIRIYVIPAKPTVRFAKPRGSDRRPDLEALKRYAEVLCRDLLSRLSCLDSSRIQRMPASGKGGLS